MRALWLIRKFRLISYRAMALDWLATGDPLTPFSTSVRDANLRIRINDFPDEPMYSLIVDDQVLGSFSNWPAKWRRPTPSEGTRESDADRALSNQVRPKN